MRTDLAYKARALEQLEVRGFNKDPCPARAVGAVQWAVPAQKGPLGFRVGIRLGFEARNSSKTQSGLWSDGPGVTRTTYSDANPLFTKSNAERDLQSAARPPSNGTRLRR